MVRRRRTYSDTSTSYAAVGATQAADVLIFPPAGFRSAQQEFKLGSGAARYEAATVALMTWGAQKGARLNVLEVNEAASEGYQGLIFNEFGAPISSTAPMARHISQPELRYSLRVPGLPGRYRRATVSFTLCVMNAAWVLRWGHSTMCRSLVRNCFQLNGAMTTPCGPSSEQ
mgnify:CR=1 FL=1